MTPRFRMVGEGDTMDSPMEIFLKWKFWRNLDLITSISVLESFNLSIFLEYQTRMSLIDDSTFDIIGPLFLL